MSFDLTRTQNPFGGGGFLVDPFLDLSGPATTPHIPKSNKPDPCLSNGAIAGSVIGTLIMCIFIGFLTWLIYLRPKFRELHYMHLLESRRITNRQHLHSIPSPSSNSNYKQQHRRQHHDDDDDRCSNQLPLDVIDYKFGTFPFRQSINSSVNGHYNRSDWQNRVSCSFRSVNNEKDIEMLDIPLLDPTFSGLNFSITGNMRAGIFVKEIIDKGLPHNVVKSSSLEQLKPGDRIMALTVCFESIVYEDALTILSYASPYPVIIRVQRPLHHTKIDEIEEKRPTTTNTTSKVKWRDDFEHYDNDTSHNQSLPQVNPPVPANSLPPLPTSTKVPPSPKKHPSSKKSHNNANTQSRIHSRASSENKGNRIKTTSNSVVTTPRATTKRCNSDLKRHRSKTNTTNSNTNSPRTKSNHITTMPASSTAKSTTNMKSSPITTNAKQVKSVTESVMSYLHYNKGGDGEGLEHSKDKPNNSEASMIPYYDSPYDYCYGQASQYQYLHQSHLNKNNNNSYSTESLTAITPNLPGSIYTIKLSSTKSCPGFRRRRERRLSSPAILTTLVVDNTPINVNEKEDSTDNSDSFV